MNIEGIHQHNRHVHSGQQAKPASEETKKTSTTMAADNTDKFEPNSTTYRNTYNKGTSKTDYAGVRGDDFSRRAGMSASQMKNEAVRGMVQAQVNGQINKGGYKPLYGNDPFILDALKAAEATSEKHDDYWGVEATAERLFTFAKTLAGGDDKMFQTMKDSFLKGFSLAEKARGGGLPDISYQTKSRVLEMFDDWEKEIAAKNAAQTAPVTDPAATSQAAASVVF
ncbi:MAG: hypothetical protein FWH20_08030 [Oscillospiraceae bacterium]|nr:hypothetical protein [Oscillospiraceae bacterium]